ncbi:MAG: hypothetical protein WC554_14120 [Clostridia bacterium]
MGQIGSMWYNIGAKTTDLEKGLSSSKNKFTALGKSAKASFTEINMGMEVFQKIGQAIGYVISAVNEMLDQRQKYVTTVVDEARLLGISTEETSKLIQASDDLFISQEKLNTALQAATRQGIDVSISGLQKLSEKYLALNPGVARSQYLLQTFGRSGADMGKLMEKGAEGIRESMNAVEDWMIVTKDTVLTIEQYKQSTDKAQEANENLKTSIANGTMPAVTKMNLAYADATNSMNKANFVQNILSAGAWMLEGALRGLDVIFGGYSDEVNNATNALNNNTQATLNNAAAQGILASKSFTSRGSIYDKTYTGGFGTSRGSIYDVDAGGASGLSMVVPAGYPNDSFRIGATTGENVEISRGNSKDSSLLAEIQGMRRELNRLPLALRDAYLFAVKSV